MVRHPAAISDDIREPVANVADLGAVHRELGIVRVLALTHLTDENEAFEVQHEVVELVEVRVLRSHDARVPSVTEAVFVEPLRM